jgi:hypothetical protein
MQCRIFTVLVRKLCNCGEGLESAPCVEGKPKVMNGPMRKLVWTADTAVQLPRSGHSNRS